MQVVSSLEKQLSFIVTLYPVPAGHCNSENAQMLLYQVSEDY